MASFARINAPMSRIRHLPYGNSTSTLCFRTSSKLPTPRTSPRQSTTPKSVFKYRFFRLAHCSGVNSNDKSGRERCTGCKSVNALWMRIKFISLNRQQISTSRVTRVTPCATAANPPTKTNSTCDETNLRVSSLRFCISPLHCVPQRLSKVQRVIVRLHPFPRCFRQTVLQQRQINAACFSRISRRTFLQNYFFAVAFSRHELISPYACECKCCCHRDQKPSPCGRAGIPSVPCGT